jgi:hypothetical protein
MAASAHVIVASVVELMGAPTAPESVATVDAANAMGFGPGGCSPDGGAGAPMGVVSPPLPPPIVPSQYTNVGGVKLAVYLATPAVIRYSSIFAPMPLNPVEFVRPIEKTPVPPAGLKVRFVVVVICASKTPLTKKRNVELPPLLTTVAAK